MIPNKLKPIEFIFIWKVFISVVHVSKISFYEKNSDDKYEHHYNDITSQYYFNFNKLYKLGRINSELLYDVYSSQGEKSRIYDIKLGFDSKTKYFLYKIEQTNFNLCSIKTSK